MRKIFLSLLVAATSLSLLASEETVGGVLFEVDNVTKTAVVKANNYSGHLYIPDVINEDVEVVGVDDDAFKNCADLVSIRFSRNIFTLNHFRRLGRFIPVRRTGSGAAICPLSEQGSEVCG